MVCPNCGEDYSDSFKSVVGGSKRKVVAVLEHYGQPFQIKGMYCPNCGFIAETITNTTGNPFHQRTEVTDPQMLYTNHDYFQYLKENDLIKDFTHYIENKRVKKEQ